MLGKLKSPLEELKELDVSSVELAMVLGPQINPIWGDGEELDISTDEGLSILKSKLAQGNINVCALLMGKNFSADDLSAEVDRIMQTADVAKALDCSVIRVDFNPGADVEKEPFLKRCVDGMKQVIDQTSGVEFGIENHGKLSNDPEYLDSLFNDVGSDRLGLTLDTGNFYWFGTPLSKVYDIIEQFAPRVKHTHVKNIKYPEDKVEQQREIGWEYKTYVSSVYEGDVDHKRIADILKNAGYEGDFSLEDESMSKRSTAEEKYEVIKKDVEHLKECIA
jgi:sugar phosphate isomerase/epimerase